MERPARMEITAHCHRCGESVMMLATPNGNGHWISVEDAAKIDQSAIIARLEAIEEKQDWIVTLLKCRR